MDPNVTIRLAAELVAVHHATDLCVVRIGNELVNAKVPPGTRGDLIGRLGRGDASIRVEIEAVRVAVGARS